MARRRLQFLPEEWDALPWWQTRLYAEGLLWELSEDPEQDARFDGLDDDEKLGALGVKIQRADVHL